MRRPAATGPGTVRLGTLALAIPAAILLVGAVLAGCAQPTGGVGGIGGRSHTIGESGTVATSTSLGSSTEGTTGPPTRTGSTAEATTTLGTCPPAPAMHTAAAGGTSDEAWAEPMLTVTWTTNGWGAPQVSGPSTIAVYPSGTVLAMIRSGTSTPSLARVLRGELDTCRLSALADSAGDLMGLDFGNPSITDQGKTLVSYRGSDGVESSLSVYALGIGDEYVTDEQRSARAKLHGLLAGVRAAGEAAQQEYRPRRLMLRVVDTDSDTVRRLTWPGSLGSLGDAHGPDCVAVRGDDAAAVREALGDGPTLARWSDGDRSVVLRAFVLLPGAVPCR